MQQAFKAIVCLRRFIENVIRAGHDNVGTTKRAQVLHRPVYQV